MLKGYCATAFILLRDFRGFRKNLAFRFREICRKCLELSRPKARVKLEDRKIFRNFTTFPANWKPIDIYRAHEIQKSRDMLVSTRVRAINDRPARFYGELNRKDAREK